MTRFSGQQENKGSRKERRNHGRGFSSLLEAELKIKD
jgi:hypothetical protein